MKFQKLAIAAALGAASTLAMAGGFDGPFVQLGIGGSSTWTKTSGLESGSTSASLNGTSSQGNVNGLVMGGYSQDFGAFNESLKGFNLAANIFYVIGNQNAGSNSSTGTRSSDGFTNTLTGNNKLQNTWGISVEPGWNFTESTLGFVKLAWLNSQYKNNVGYSEPDGYSENFSFSKTVNGFGYGLGVKQLITKNVFAGVDLMGVTYNTNSLGGDFQGVSFKPTQFMGFASIGYKF
jgi:opacity protein-like surface antigen